MFELIEYLDERDRSPFAIWRASLDVTARTRIELALVRLSQGNLSSVKGVGSGVLEMRLDFGPGFRIYIAKDGETYIILLGGGTKKRQQADIEAAKQRWSEYKREKRIDS